MIRYGQSAAVIFVASLLRFWLDPVLEDAGFVVYFGAVVIAAWLGGLGPSLLAVVLSLLASMLFFGPPPGTPPEPPAKVIAGLGLFLFIGVTTALLSESMRAAQRRAEAQLAEAERQREQLRQSDRYKDEFLAVLGHELRNPVAGIAAAADVLQTLEVRDNEFVEMRGIIGRQVAHMTHLIDDLLDVSRISRGKMTLKLEPVDLRELVASAIHDFRRTLQRRRLEIGADLPARPVWTMADPTRLTQVLTNLLHNADRFSLPESAVHVSLIVDDAASRATIVVRDTGSGIDAAILPRVFEPFQQADQGQDRCHGGLGLGLALVKGLVELHGGAVAAASPGPNLGAEFTIRLPLLDVGEVPTVQAVPAENARRRRVLVIEDRRDAAIPLQALLQRLGHEVELAADGPAGLAAARARVPDVVLCDIGLPSMSGYEVAEALRGDPATSSAYLVAVTGYTRDEDRQRALAAGFHQHLAKPVGFSQLRQLMVEID